MREDWSEQFSESLNYSNNKFDKKVTVFASIGNGEILYRFEVTKY